VFESLKATIQDLLNGRVAPTDRRAAIYEMKRALVSAKLGVEDLREGVEITRRKLNTEREQLETVRRRKTLAEGINDAETVALAVKYEQQHGDHVAVLERKLDAQEAEAQLAERELAGMMSQLKAANAGVGSSTDRTGSRGGGISDEELGLPDDSKLHAELDNLARANKRSAADADAEAKLAELKKRMGQ
jgi:phage shock protein A